MSDLFSMTQVGAGASMYDYKKKIQEIRAELESADFEDLPELIESANLLRSNKYLEGKAQKQTELIHAYGEYSEALEQMLVEVFEIQVALKDVLKEQSSLLSKPVPKKRSNAKKSLKRGSRRRP